MEGGTVKVIVDGKEVASAGFCFDDTQIRVDTVKTKKVYRRCGYGRLLFDALKCIAQQKKMPLLLCSSNMGIPFYESIGLLHLDNPEVQKLIIFGNLRTKEDIERKIDNDDFIWLPKMKTKPILYL